MPCIKKRISISYNNILILFRIILIAASGVFTANAEDLFRYFH